MFLILLTLFIIVSFDGLLYRANWRKMIRLLKKSYPAWLESQHPFLRPRYLPFVNLSFIVIPDVYFLFINKTRFPNNQELANLIRKARIMWVIGMVSGCLFVTIFILAPIIL